MASSALPLNVASTPKAEDKNRTPTPSFRHVNALKSSTVSPGDISSPHELTAFVETLLEQLDAKFDDMSSQILDRMAQMSTRVDSLEAAIQDIINGDMSVPQSPSPNQTPNVTRSDSAQL